MMLLGFDSGRVQPMMVSLRPLELVVVIIELSVKVLVMLGGRWERGFDTISSHSIS